jgi:hypothetical protein
MDNNFNRYMMLMNKYGKFDKIPEKYKSKEMYCIYYKKYHWLHLLKVDKKIKTKEFFIELLSLGKISLYNTDEDIIPDDRKEREDFFLEIVKRNPKILLSDFPKKYITDKIIRYALYYGNDEIEEFFWSEYSYLNEKLSFKTWFFAATLFNNYRFHMFIPYKYKNKKMCSYIFRRIERDDINSALDWTPKKIFTIPFFYKMLLCNHDFFNYFTFEFDRIRDYNAYKRNISYYLF